MLDPESIAAHAARRLAAEGYDTLADELTAEVERLQADNLAAIGALRGLVLLKRFKDQEGKTRDYFARRAVAWNQAEDVIASLMPITAAEQKPFESSPADA